MPRRWQARYSTNWARWYASVALYAEYLRVGAEYSGPYRMLPAGFYYKTFIHPRFAWKHVFEPIVRQSAGLGKAPKARYEDRYEQAYAFCDLLVVGGGIAGLQAARLAGAAGARVIVMEQTPHWGGRAPVDGDIIDGAPAEDWKSTRTSPVSTLTISMRSPSKTSPDGSERTS